MFTVNRYNCKMDGLTQGCPVLLLDGLCPAKFSSNPETTNQFLQATLENTRQVNWGKVKLNSDDVDKFDKIIMEFQWHLVSSLKST